LSRDIIRNLRRQEHEADKVEAMIKAKILNMDIDPVTIFHMIRLAEIIGSIADHAENAGDMMRAMISIADHAENAGDMMRAMIAK